MDLYDLMDFGMDMRSMPKQKEIVSFLKNNIEPIIVSDGELVYRASAYLLDGLLLPCVVFRNSQKAYVKMEDNLKQSIKRSFFGKKIRETYIHYLLTLNKQNTINIIDISKVEKSKYSLPAHLLKRFDSTDFFLADGFVGIMSDGTTIGFGSNSNYCFLDMPDGYTADDIVEVKENHYVLTSGQVVERFRDSLDNTELYKDTVTYANRPYFTCYLNDL